MEGECCGAGIGTMGSGKRPRDRRLNQVRLSYVGSRHKQQEAGRLGVEIVALAKELNTRAQSSAREGNSFHGRQRIIEEGKMLQDTVGSRHVLHDHLGIQFTNMKDLT